MEIVFEKVTPSPLDGVIDLHTDIWNKDFKLKVSGHTKVYAPSGKGKSTFMHMIYGLRSDYNGNIYIDARNIATYSNNDWAAFRQSRVSLMFQDLRLFLDLTAWENIVLKYSLNAYTDLDTLASYFAQLNISHIQHKVCGKLSYGERQRVAIIRALVQPFELLLLDEPFSHLDRNNAAIACTIIEKECKKRNAYYLFTSLGSDTFLDEAQAYRL